MLVDDERPARELLKMLINWEQAGFYIIAEARNGQQALEIYRKNPPDLIITDVQMPVMDGLELLQEIRKTDQEQKIVILSCHESFSYARRALKLGVLDYLIKDSLTEEGLYDLLAGIENIEEGEKEEKVLDCSGILDAEVYETEEERVKGRDRLQRILDQKREFYCCVCTVENFEGTREDWKIIERETNRLLQEEGIGDIIVHQQQLLIVLCMMECQSSRMNKRWVTGQLY